MKDEPPPLQRREFLQFTANFPQGFQPFKGFFQRLCGQIKQQAMIERLPLNMLSAFIPLPFFLFPAFFINTLDFDGHFYIDGVEIGI